MSRKLAEKAGCVEEVAEVKAEERERKPASFQRGNNSYRRPFGRRCLLRAALVRNRANTTPSVPTVAPASTPEIAFKPYSWRVIMASSRSMAHAAAVAISLSMGPPGDDVGRHTAGPCHWFGISRHFCIGIDSAWYFDAAIVRASCYPPVARLLQP